MKVKYINWGIGSRVKDTIYLNKDLKKYYNLHAAVLLHELSHTSNPSYAWADLMLDLNSKELKEVKRDYYKFVFTHPKALIEFLPIWCYQGNIFINPLLLTFYFIVILLILGIKWLI